MIHDLRYARRSLARTPSLTLTILATLALGIGSTGAMFGIADRLVLNPLPFVDADRLVFLWRANNAPSASGISTVSGREVEVWRSLRVFEALEPFAVARAVLTGQGEPRNLTGWAISPGFLPTLHVTPAIGRAFDAKDAQPGAEPTVILGHNLWRDLYGSDPGIIGRSITLDDETRVVIGVMRAAFALPIGDVGEYWVVHPPNGSARLWLRQLVSVPSDSLCSFSPRPPSS